MYEFQFENWPMIDLWRVAETKSDLAFQVRTSFQNTHLLQ